MAWTGVVTNSGEGLLQALLGGASLTLTGVKTGSGTTNDMYAATALANEVASGTMSSHSEEDGVRIRMKIRPSATTYKMREIGVFGRVGSDAPVLFALMQDATGIDIPDEESFPDFVYNMSTFLAMSNTDNFSVTVDPGASVSEAEFQAAMAGVTPLTRNYYASTSSVSCPLSANRRSYIITSSGAAASGILDPDKGALIFVTNGKYAVAHRGADVSVAEVGGNLVVSCNTACPMNMIEI